jgi:DNA (cytosine-5)-methyltransferase 3A
MNVLSLFDGMSCGQIALNRLGIKYDNYFASEIKTAAIKVTQANYPKTIQLGDIKNITKNKLPKIDLILAGSPCQDLSQGSKERKGLEGNKSNLFFEFLRLLKEIKPKHYILENVIMEKDQYQKISELLRTYPVRINSSLVSAQQRDRLYWCNFGEEYFDLLGFRHSKIPQPKDKKIMYKDIIEDGYVVQDKATCLMEGYSRPHKSNRKRFRRWHKFGFLNIVFTKQNLSPYFNRVLSKIEMERLQTVPENYTKVLSWKEAASVLGDGWTIDVICHLLKQANIGEK